MQVAVNKVMKERGLCGGGNVIMYFLSMSISCDQPCIFYTAQVMGDSGSTHADSSRDIKYAFLTVTQQPEDLKTCTVTKLLEGTGHICTGIFRWHCLKNVVNIPVIMWENWSCHINYHAFP